MSHTNRIFNNRVLQLILFAILIYGANYSIQFVENIYRQKSGFYTPNYWPPTHYIKGYL